MLHHQSEQFVVIILHPLCTWGSERDHNEVRNIILNHTENMLLFQWLFIIYLFVVYFSSSDYTASNGRIISEFMINELERMWKETVIS
jgi:hypothetical protein